MKLFLSKNINTDFQKGGGFSDVENTNIKKIFNEHENINNFYFRLPKPNKPYNIFIYIGTEFPELKLLPIKILQQLENDNFIIKGLYSNTLPETINISDISKGSFLSYYDKKFTYNGNSTLNSFNTSDKLSKGSNLVLISYFFESPNFINSVNPLTKIYQFITRILSSNKLFFVKADKADLADIYEIDIKDILINKDNYLISNKELITNRKKKIIAAYNYISKEFTNLKRIETIRNIDIKVKKDSVRLKAYKKTITNMKYIFNKSFTINSNNNIKNIMKIESMIRNSSGFFDSCIYNFLNSISLEVFSKNSINDIIIKNKVNFYMYMSKLENKKYYEYKMYENLKKKLLFSQATPTTPKLLKNLNLINNLKKFKFEYMIIKNNEDYIKMIEYINSIILQHMNLYKKFSISDQNEFLTWISVIYINSFNILDAFKEKFIPKIIEFIIINSVRNINLSFNLFYSRLNISNNKQINVLIINKSEINNKYSSEELTTKLNKITLKDNINIINFYKKLDISAKQFLNVKMFKMSKQDIKDGRIKIFYKKPISINELFK